MEIQSVSIVGLGALGVLFGSHLAAQLPREALRIVADRDRIEKYRRDGVFANGTRCDFTYLPADEACRPCDLLLIAVKFGELPAAIAAAKNQVGPDTLILSLLNGISSEGIVGEVFGAEKVLPSVAQGMDAVKVGNRLSYTNMGLICFGPSSAAQEEKAARLRRFFERTGLPHLYDADMQKRLWGKFMLNVGVNQTVAVYAGDYGVIQRPGAARDTMVAAMTEVLRLSEAEGVFLTQADLDYWLGVVDALDPRGKPSMRQDLEAGRRSEVGLFSGTVLALGDRHGLDFSVNRALFEHITALEERF